MGQINCNVATAPTPTSQAWMQPRDGVASVGTDHGRLPYNRVLCVQQKEVCKEVGALAEVWLAEGW